MALIVQAAAPLGDYSSPQSLPGPDYEAEAEQGRLKLIGDQQLQRWSQLNPPRTLAEEILAGFRAGYWKGENSYDLESPGGHVRTVTGAIAYLDEQAETFIVVTADGQMARVPLRDVVATRGTPQEEHRQLGDAADDDGLGVGRYQPPDERRTRVIL
jgi:hypothetical protein